MYFLIGVWGGKRKLYAAIKFFLYTLIGSVLMLLGILALYFAYFDQTGVYTFDLLRLWSVDYPAGLQFWVFLSFFVAFAIQSPDVPVPHVASRRARGSSDRRLGDSRGRAF